MNIAIGSGIYNPYKFTRIHLIAIIIDDCYEYLQRSFSKHNRYSISASVDVCSGVFMCVGVKNYWDVNED